MKGMLLDWKSIGSILATFVFLRAALRDFLLPPLHQFLGGLFSRLVSAANPHISILIHESNPSSSSSGINELFDTAHAYLGDKCRLISSSISASGPLHFNVPVLRLSKLKNSRYLSFSMDTNQRLDDYFPARGVPGAIRVRWSSHSSQHSNDSPGGGSDRNEHRHYELSFHSRHQARVQEEYIPYVIEYAANIQFKNRERRLYTNGVFGRHWSSMPFAHPSTFDTLAIDPALKDEIQVDLRKFTARRDYYARVGRAWKRGYLLHGAPGTGKTSLIAAIANFLEFDIYDLELTAVTSNSELRQLLVSTSSKSVVVVEDVDCTLDLSDRKMKTDPDYPPAQLVGSGDGRGVKGMGTGSCYNRVNMSGVLNFVDGLWSSCVGERLMIFTTNHVEKLDPALLRPGRMDGHIHLSYCRLPAFKMLAKNYLGVGEGHHLTKEAGELLQEVDMTPAEVAELFLGCEDDADEGMRRVVEEMRRRRALMLQAEEHSDGPGENDDGVANFNVIVENGVGSAHADEEAGAVM